MAYQDWQYQVWSRRRERAFERDYGRHQRDVWRMPRDATPAEPPKLEKPNLWIVPAFIFALLSLIFAA